LAEPPLKVYTIRGGYKNTPIEGRGYLGGEYSKDWGYIGIPPPKGYIYYNMF